MVAQVRCDTRDTEAPWHMSVGGQPEGRFTMIDDARLYCRETGYEFVIVNMREPTGVPGKRGRPDVAPRPCTEDGCTRMQHAKGLCKRHYLRMWKLEHGGRECERKSQRKYRIHRKGVSE